MAQEANKLVDRFKDPQFCRLFEEYARDMSDPQVRWGGEVGAGTSDCCAA
jgi:hypothetical protein